MKKLNSRETVNLFFSAFLIVAYIVCAHFFSQFAATLSATTGSIISIIINVVFGLLLFYATRVGEGKAIKRFSPVTLVVMVLPSLYIIIASLATGLPFHDVFASGDTSLTLVVTLACTVLGYGIPYTFLSGFEIADENEEENIGGADEETTVVLEGGIEADILESEAEVEESEEPVEEATETTEEVVEETEATDEN